ncbi:MAG: TraR/DksA family transcriptional regulator [Steroidobacteraceae bacterium]
MSGLTQEQVDRLNQLMEERRTRELEEIRAVAERSHDDRRQEVLAGRAADQLDQALGEIAQSAAYAIVRQDIQDVRDIDAARRRIIGGTYGVCIECGVEIGYPRLLAYPTAKRCIGCQREHERQQAARQGRSAP